MEVRIDTQEKKLLLLENRSELLDSFLSSSNDLGNESLKVDHQLFTEAANKRNIQFEFIRMKTCKLDRISLDISNAKNALLEADYAIADSGLLVVDTQDPDVLLTIFLAETLHVVVPASKILHSMDDFELISGKTASNIGRGIASLSGSKNRNYTMIRTMVYVIEDL